MKPAVPEALRGRLIGQVQRDGVPDVNAGQLDSLLRNGALAVGTCPDGRLDVRVSPDLYALCRRINKGARLAEELRSDEEYYAKREQLSRED